jgi:hypothetical protein
MYELLLFPAPTANWLAVIAGGAKQSMAGLLTQDGSELRRPVSSRSVGADITLERSEQMPKYLDR